MMYMNNKAPFYRTQWGIPSQNQQQQWNHINKTSSKVINIPVHFVGSEQNRAYSATKIQKVVRGFLVRKTVKKITAMKMEVEEIEAKVHDSMSLIKRDEKERLKVSETIMNLLFKLDSVRVLNYYYSGVREFRKSVIKKAIAIQEMVDQMVEGEDVAESGYVGGSNLVEEEEENCLVKEEGVEGVCENAFEKLIAESEGDDEENGCVVKEEEEEEEEEGRKREEHRELLEKMVMENERMMGMMEKLFEKNELQTRLLGSLSQRVEMLEKAFACDKNLRRRCNNKKLRRNNGFI